MLESISPEARIFHIARECYVVYLGTQIDDIKPFLRIGNTRDIPDEVLEVLSTTVITDVHVGNPLLEILLAPRFHGRYLGDTGIVDTISRFFKSFDLPTDDIVDYREVEDGERRHMVWFYTSGNIHLRYDGRIIFDLYRREKEDRHFVYLYEEAKRDFLRNPLRYVRQDFAGHGIYLADENCFWYENGDFISFTPHPGITAKMMSDGVDPDFITTIAYNLKEDGLDSHDAAEFIGFVKRMRKRRKQLRVITTYPAIQRRLKLLFPERRGRSSTLKIADVSGKRRTTFHDSIVSIKNERPCIKRSDLPDIAFGWEIEDGLSIDIKQGLVKYNSEIVSQSFSIPRGFPIELRGHSAIPSQISNKYITLMLSSIKRTLSDKQYQVLGALESYLKLLVRDVEGENTLANSLLKQNSDKLRNNLRRFPGKNGGPAWFFLSNCHSILNLIIAELGEEHDLSGNIRQVVNAIRRLISRLPIPSPLLPFWGHFYLGEKPTLLWFAVKKGFNVASIRAAEESAERIVKVINLDESPWHENLTRLLALIRSLGRGGQGSLTEKQFAYLGQTGRETIDKKKRELEEAGPRPAERYDKSRAAIVVSMARGATRTRGKSRRKWPWILSACALLLLGGVLIWEYTGDAPWGSMIHANRIEDGIAVVDLADDIAVVLPSEVNKVDIDVAPKTVEEIEAYLNVENRIIITEVDIHLAANEIAVLNGFRDLDYKVFTGRDPDWISPGNTLNLPEGDVYVIGSGDTIWFLAAREVRSDAEKRMAIFDDSVSVLEASDADFESRTEALLILREISENSKAAQVREMAREVLLSLRK